MNWEDKIIQKIEKKLEKKDSASILLSIIELINDTKYDQILLEENLSETLQLILVNKNPINVLKIKEPSNEVILLALEKQPNLLKDITNKYELNDEIIMYILSKDYNLISEIKEPSSKIKYFYLSQNRNLHYSLAKWDYTDRKLREAVYRVDPTFIKFMSEHLTKEEYYKIVYKVPEVACYMPNSIKKIPTDIQKYVIDNVHEKILAHTSFLKIFDIGILQEEIALRKAKNDSKGVIIQNTLQNLMKHYKKEEYDMDINEIVSILNNKKQKSYEI